MFHDLQTSSEYVQGTFSIMDENNRAGKKLKMSARRHFEASEMSSKVRDFRQWETEKRCTNVIHYRQTYK